MYHRSTAHSQSTAMLGDGLIPYVIPVRVVFALPDDVKTETLQPRGAGFALFFVA